MNLNETIENKETGEKLTLLLSGRYNGGASNIYEIYLPPNNPGPPMHYHTAFIEVFTVKKGSLVFYTDTEDEPIVLLPGQNIIVQKEQPHRFANATARPVVFTVEARPAGGLVRAFQMAYGVANDGGARKDGLPANLFVRLYFIRLSQGYLTTIPLFIQKMLFTLAVFILNITGKRRKLDAYINY